MHCAALGLAKCAWKWERDRSSWRQRERERKQRHTQRHRLMEGWRCMHTDKADEVEREADGGGTHRQTYTGRHREREGRQRHTRMVTDALGLPTPV